MIMNITADPDPHWLWQTEPTPTEDSVPCPPPTPRVLHLTPLLDTLQGSLGEGAGLRVGGTKNVAPLVLNGAPLPEGLPGLIHQVT